VKALVGEFIKVLETTAVQNKEKPTRKLAKI